LPLHGETEETGEINSQRNLSSVVTHVVG